MATTLTLHVKPTVGGERVTLSIGSTATVGELKEELAAKNGMPAAEQRLIFKGQILKDDERTIDAYGELLQAVDEASRLS